MLNVTMLGGMSFVVNGTRIRNELGQSGRRLACYLLTFPGRAHRREKLADMFWENLEPDNARAALNTAIWRLRKLLESSGSVRVARQLITTSDEVILESCESIFVDLHSFLERIRKSKELATVGNAAGTSFTLQLAVDEYGGPFLDGEDHDWIVLERERLQCLYMRALLDLMNNAARDKRYEDALDYGRRILGHDSLRENVHRSMMLLLVMNGQRAEAIHHYGRCKSLLFQELKIDPMPQTMQLAELIRSSSIDASLDELAKTQFVDSAHLRRVGDASHF
ncbi:AfsR/SARP family transcriptional regulator [Rhizobium leguminosarum]